MFSDSAESLEPRIAVSVFDDLSTVFSATIDPVRALRLKAYPRSGERTQLRIIHYSDYIDEECTSLQVDHVDASLLGLTSFQVFKYFSLQCPRFYKITRTFRANQTA